MKSVESFDESRRLVEINLCFSNLMVGVLESTLDAEKALTPRAAQCISHLRSIMKPLRGKVLDICENVEPASEWKARDEIFWKEEGDPEDIAVEAIRNWLSEEVIENHGDSGLQGRLIYANFSIHLTMKRPH